MPTACFAIGAAVGVGQSQQELAFRGAPHLLDDEPGLYELLCDAWRSELGADLCQQVLALLEVNGDISIGERHVDGLLGPQTHFYPLFVLVPEGDVAESIRIEVGTHLLVEHMQYVPVELGGHARRVVVGGHEPCSILDQVRSEQERIIA